MKRAESRGVIFISLKSHCPWRPSVPFIHPLDLKLSQGSLWQNGRFREPVTGCGANQGRMSEASEKSDRDLFSGSRIQSGAWASEMSLVSGLKGSVYSWKNYRSIWCWAAPARWVLQFSKPGTRAVQVDMSSAWNGLPATGTCWPHTFFKTQLKCPLSCGA